MINIHTRSRAELEQYSIALDRRSKQLDEERAKFTEAAVRLGRERAAFEVFKVTFCQFHIS
jgi:hypothetical protein